MKLRVAEFLALGGALWNVFLVMTRSLQPLLVVAMVCMLGWALASRQPWPFSISAESEHATLTLFQNVETNWRIGGSLICIRSSIKAISLPLVATDSPCPGRRWQAYNLNAQSEAVLRIPASSDGGGSYTVRIDVNPDGSLSLQLEPSEDASGLLLFSDSGSSLVVGTSVLLHFPPPVKGRAASRILLPFTGTGTIGKDVSWREATLLRNGVVSIYTRSEEAAGGRELIATAELMPGDRVNLNQHGASTDAVAKGFIHFDLTAEAENPPSMRVVAFGESDAVQIVRFGEQTFSFSPGILARLTRHSAITTWGVLIFSLLGMMAVYKGGSELGEGSLRESRTKLRSKWRALRGGGV